MQQDLDQLQKRVDDAENKPSWQRPTFNCIGHGTYQKEFPDILAEGEIHDKSNISDAYDPASWHIGDLDICDLFYKFQGLKVRVKIKFLDD